MTLDTESRKPRWSVQCREFSSRIIERLASVTIVHHVGDDGSVWGTQGRKILRRFEEKGEWNVVGRFPFVAGRDLLGWTRPLARASRSDKCNVYENSSGNVIGIRGGAVYEIRGGTLHERLRIQGDCVLNCCLCEDRQGWTCFGEYFRNSGRGPVRIWRVSPDLSKSEIAYEFEANTIRHVHGVFRDPYAPDALWITTGDRDGECFVGRTDDRFRSLEFFGDGTQVYRAVVPFFREDHVCWITDSNLKQNYACRMNRRDATLEIGQEFPCSGWYGTTTKEGLSLAFTTVESGPAIKSEMSSVLISRDGFDWSEIAAFRKDGWKPYRLFKYGVISCPTGTMTLDSVYLSGEGLRGFDGISLRMKIGSHL